MAFIKRIIKCVLESAVFCLFIVFTATGADNSAKKDEAAKQNIQLKNDSLLSYMNEENQQNESADAVAPEKQDGQEGRSNWISSIASAIAEKGAKAISADEKDAVQPRSNASVFDIAGIMLRMNVAQTLEAMKKRGYVKTAENYEIPNFIRWRYEEACRTQGVVGYERTMACVVRLAQKNNYQYVEKLLFSSYRTQENIEVHFTSNFTGNKVYNIIYQSAAANIKGKGAKADYLRNIKIFDFWKKINQKYGIPDNREQVIWGLGDNKPYLKAKTGTLILRDPMLLELDYARMSREDQKFMNTAVYTF